MDGGAIPPSPVAERSRHPLIGRAVAVWMLSFVVLAWKSGRPAWSLDEGATAIVVRRSFSEALRTFTYDPALEPYYLMLKVFSPFSTSEPWLRLPSVLAMACGVTAVWGITQRLTGQRTGTFAVLVMLALPATSVTAQTARPYALSLLAVALIVLCWDHENLPYSRRRQALLALLVVLAGATHAYTLLIVPVLVFVSGVVPRADRRREMVAMASSGAVGALLLAPFLRAVTQRANGQPDPPPVTVQNVAAEVLRLPAAVLSRPLAMPLAEVTLGLVLVGVTTGWLAGPPTRRAATLAAVWLVLPPACLCFFQGVTGSPGLVARYWLFCLPAIALACALALDWLWSRARAVAAFGVVGLWILAVPSQVGLRGVDGHFGEGFRAMTEVMALPGVADAPLLVHPRYVYRAVVSNDPAMAARMPLMSDPVPSGRVNPAAARAGSSAFRSMVRDHEVAVVLGHDRRVGPKPPSKQDFPGVPGAMRAYPSAAVLCSYFGWPLGIFTTSAASSSDAQARLLATQITAIAPTRVSCSGG